MKLINDINLGFGDAENYQRRENKNLFNSIFVKNEYLDQLLAPSSFFVIGEKGTGKTAYSVFLSNNNYKNTISQLKYIRETDYRKFLELKTNKHLGLSDYSSIWKVIIMLLLAKNISTKELDHSPFSKPQKIKSLMNAIDQYYEGAFSPEIINVLEFVQNSEMAAEIVAKFLKIGSKEITGSVERESRFQLNLLFIQHQFEEALRNIKLKNNQIIFIDGIDIRPATVEYDDYLECIKGLGDAIWSLNNDYFPSIKDSEGRLRAVLLLRPDIFNSIGFQNSANKVRDNSVFLDWRTTYPDYRTSKLFSLTDKMLSSQQETGMEIGEAWDYYFPFLIDSASPLREHDNPFITFLRYSYSRPRDMVTMLQLLKEETLEKGRRNEYAFGKKTLGSNAFLNKFSEFLMGGIRDQLSFYYSNKDYEMFLRFFTFLNGCWEFNFKKYLEAYNKFQDYVLEHHDTVPEFVESESEFLQFLYDTNIICYIEDTDDRPLIQWCYRERSTSNIAPKVRVESRYRIHYGLVKALNLGQRIG